MTTNPVICFKFASRSRTEKFFSAVQNIIELCATDNYFILATLDTDDAAMNTDEVRSRMNIMNKLGRRQIVHYKYGTSKSKIDAINRDLNDSDVPAWDILVNMSDDMVFRVAGFDQQIINDMQSNFPKFDGCLHYYDGSPKGGNQQDKANGEILMTMSIMGVNYYKSFGYIYHPDYTSLWCDNEATEVAEMLGKKFYSETVLFEHMHPAHGKSATDPQYEKTESFFHADKEVYERRKAMNFEIDKVVLTRTEFDVIAGTSNELHIKMITELWYKMLSSKFVFRYVTYKSNLPVCIQEYRCLNLLFKMKVDYS